MVWPLFVCYFCARLLPALSIFVHRYSICVHIYIYIYMCIYLYKYFGSLLRIEINLPDLLKSKFVHSHLLLCTSTMVWPLFVCYFLYVCYLPCPFLSTGTAVWPLLQFSSCNVLLCICMLHVHFCSQAQGFGHFFNFSPVFYNLGIFDPWASQTAAPVSKN